LIPGSKVNDLSISYIIPYATADSLGISELGDESLDTLPLAINDHLREYSGVGSCTSCSSDPPFGSPKVRGVNSELGHGETTDDTVHTEDSLVHPIAYIVSIMMIKAYIRAH
jgi:hypothetical protein